jgi:uncharacterized protein YlxW (UPF0749 family)
MKNGIKAQFVVAVVCFILGLMLVMQFRSTQTNGGAITSLQRAQELTSELKNISDERDQLRIELAQLRNRIAEYEKSASNVSGLAEAMQKELDKVRTLAGLLPGNGPGVVITLNDGEFSKQTGEDPNLSLIHDEDILKVVNELFAAGAEAISINGQRVIANTEIRCVGPTIIINSVRMAPPFIIQAIGDPDTLETSMKMRGGIIEYLQVFGIQVNIKKQASIDMPAYIGPIQFKYFKPVKAGE